MKWTVGNKISSGYALALLILILIGIMSYKTTTDLIIGIELVEKTQNEMVLLNGIISQLAESESSERGYVLTGKESYLEQYDRSYIKIPEDFRSLELIMSTNPVLLEKLNLLETNVTAKLKGIAAIIDLRKSEGEGAARLLVNNDTGKESMDQIINLVSSIKIELNTLLEQRKALSSQSSQMIFKIIIWGIPLSMIVICIVAIVIVRDITIPLRESTELAERIAGGDLSKSSDIIKRQDEIGALFKAFDKMIVSLREINQEIVEGVNVITSASSEIMASTAQVASGSMETSMAISETTSSVEEVKQSALMASEKARAVSEMTKETVQISESGLKSVEQSLVGMNLIQDQVESIAQSLVRLSEQSQAIGEIISSVNDIAEQSNLLAVNAAIEAAKAGEQGKGFTVVAQEVKVLAEQSKEATAQVRSILSEVLKAINTAILATEQGSKAVNAGVVQSRETGETIRQMSDGIENSAQMAIQISITSQQQLTGMDQIAQAMESIRQASEQNVGGTKQVEYTMQNLHELGQRLKKTLERYKL